MAEIFQRTVEVEDERVNERGSAAEAAGVAARLARVRLEATKRGETTPTIDDIGTTKFRLRERGEADDRDAMISGLRGEAAGMAKFAIAQAPAAENGEVGVIEQPTATLEKEAEKRELTPEDARATLATLEARFNSPEHKALHKGVEWLKVKAALEANPAALWSINKMQAAGHDPDVYDADAEGFDIGTCSKESPASGRNCVYGRENARWLRENRPDEKFNGSAEEMAEAMGVALMDPVKYKKVLQAKGKFDNKSWSWLLTSTDILSTGIALYGYRYDRGVFELQNSAYSHDAYRAWRGSLRVKWQT